MQLGELQSQIARFERRDVSIIAVSVDRPTDSLAMIGRLGLTFDLGSDPEQEVVRAFAVQNPETRELALHAVYIVDQKGEVFYRKVARRRPTSEELIDAVDAFMGVYPAGDDRPQRSPIAVAYPENNFQALLEVSRADVLPEKVSAGAVEEVLRLTRERSGDDALIAFKALCAANSAATEDELFIVSAWLTRQLFFSDNKAAIAAGVELARRLNRVAELESAWQSAATEREKDQALHLLARARAGLSLARADVSNHADDWQLRYVKTSLRSYREVARAAKR